MRRGPSLTILLLVLWVGSAQASQFGRQGFSGDPQVNGGATCTACHAPGAVQPSLDLVGPRNVVAGNTYTYTATLRGGPGITAGFSASTKDSLGTLLAVDGDLRLIGNSVSHTRPKRFSDGQVSFSFSWTAPPFNTQVTLYSAGNSSNGELDLLGDGIAIRSLVVNVTGGTAPPPPPPPPAQASAELTVFANGLQRPVVISNAGDQRLFVAEQPGLVRIIDANGTVRSQPYLDISSAVDDAGNEQGLLGLAFHPDYANNGFFYVYYTIDRPNFDRSRVSRFQVFPDRPNFADPASELVILEFEQPRNNHNAGDMHFGPDGYLYIASGDGGGAGDPDNLGQNNSTLLGKLLRIDVDSAEVSTDCGLPGARYAIPADNAFTDGRGGDGCDEIWATGLRNPWKIAFDRVTGDLWIADVGQSAREEVNFVTANTSAGLNFGWRCYEGELEFDLDSCEGSYYQPIHTTRHSENCSITGGRVYRGSQELSLYGRYFFTDICNTAIFGLSQSASGVRVEEVIPAGNVSTPVAFGEDQNGELYLASLDGTIYRINSTQAVEQPLGEAGIVTVAQSSRNQWHLVTFEQPYSDPIVVMGPPSFNGGQPTSMRVQNVTANSFEFQIDEWDYLDQVHNSESIGYLVVERGIHDLGGGRTMIADSASVKHVWNTVNFTEQLSVTPLVFAQVTSRNGGQTVTERLQDISVDAFQVRIQEEEANDGRHVFETVDWIAIEPGITGKIIAGELAGVSDSVETFNFPRIFDNLPALIADMQTVAGKDPATPRLTNLGTSTASVFVQEELSRDTETRRRADKLGYIILEPGTL
ncbi:MAG: choice-of-anchor V domain-containing protein [Pseudomonadota bacterium]